MPSRSVIGAAAVGAVGLCVLAYSCGRAHHGDPPLTNAGATPAASADAREIVRPSLETSPPRRPRTRASHDPATAPAIAPGRSADASAALHTSATIDAAADALPDLLRGWDAGVATDLFGDIDLAPLEAKLAWMHDAVGTCEAGTSMGSTSASHGRFAYVCERGVVEAGFSVSDPEDTHVAHMRAGVREVQPPEPVVAAARAATALIETWDEEAFEDRFAQSFRDKLGETMPAFMQRLRDSLGACAVGPVDLASPDGALFVLDCEHGRRTLVVSVDSEGLIRALRVVPLRRDPLEDAASQP